MPPAVIDTIPPYPMSNPRGEPTFPGPQPSAPFPPFPAGNSSNLFPSIPAGPQFPHSPAVPGPSPFPSIPAGPGLPQNAGMGARFPPPAPGFGGETAGKRPPLNTSPRSAPGGGLFPSLCFVCLKKEKRNEMK